MSTNFSDDGVAEQTGRLAFNRRAFLKGALASASVVAAAGLAACSPASEGGGGGGSEGGNNSAASDVITPGDVKGLGAPPEIDEASVTETIECDLVVVGAGISGLATTRSAAEAGAKVINIEKKAAISIHGFDVAINNSFIAEDQGIHNDPKALMNEYQRRTVGRCNYPIVKHWAKGSGDAFEWYLAPKRDDAEFMSHLTIYCAPAWPEHDPGADLTQYFLGTVSFKEDPANPIGSPYWMGLGEANKAAAEAANAEFHFLRAVIKLDVDSSGKVIGCYAKDAEGNIYKYVTSRGVILASGGAAQFGAGSEVIHKVFAPQLYKNWRLGTGGTEPEWETMFEVLPDPMQAIGGTTGDGQLMAAWIGGQMDAWADTAMGSCETGIGGTCALSVNQLGERYWNEDMGIWQKHDAVFNLPGKICYDIIDVNWRDRLKYQTWGHRNFAYVDAEVAVDWNGFDYVDNFHQEFLAGVGNPEGVIPSLDPHAGTVYGAETLEELADMIKVPKETFLATIERYNGFCDKGSDDDFGCDPLKLMPIKTGPFFACSAMAFPAMAAYAGLVTDGQFRVMHTEGRPLEGLWAVGNCGGAKFSPSYSTMMGGMNHGPGLTYGYYCGKYAAGETVEL
jgi:succinate dehydrogenase/fumarate reductase flavoprotein subunit